MNIIEILNRENSHLGFWGDNGLVKSYEDAVIIEDQLHLEKIVGLIPRALSYRVIELNSVNVSPVHLFIVTPNDFGQPLQYIVVRTENIDRAKQLAAYQEEKFRSLFSVRSVKPCPVEQAPKGLVDVCPPQHFGAVSVFYEGIILRGPIDGLDASALPSHLR